LEKKYRQESEPVVAAKSSVKQESLLKPKFQKPSTSTGSSGRVEKTNAKKSSIIETRHAKIVYQKQPNGVGINNKRMNLLRALNKVKTEQVEDNYFESDENTSSTMVELGKYVRSDEDCSDQSSYDGITAIDGPAANTLKLSRKRRSPDSNASSENSSDWLKLLPPLPIEPPPKTEYDQEEFLALLFLITPKVAESVKLQRTKRKRRTCAKNEKTDFHYGKFDINEVSLHFKLKLFSLFQFPF
jgi:hypothetical protein